MNLVVYLGIKEDVIIFDYNTPSLSQHKSHYDVNVSCCQSLGLLYYHNLRELIIWETMVLY